LDQTISLLGSGHHYKFNANQKVKHYALNISWKLNKQTSYDNIVI